MKFNLKASAILLCTFAAGSFSAKAQSLAQPLSTHATSYKAAVKEFSDHLFKMAADKAHEEGYHMPYATRTSLQTFINTGVEKMFTAGLTEEKYTKKAEDNIMRFVTVMIDDAHTRGVTGVLDIIAFRTAQGMCCPNGWPFC